MDEDREPPFGSLTPDVPNDQNSDRSRTSGRFSAIRPNSARGVSGVMALWALKDRLGHRNKGFGELVGRGGVGVLSFVEPCRRSPLQGRTHVYQSARLRVCRSGKSADAVQFIA